MYVIFFKIDEGEKSKMTVLDIVNSWITFVLLVILVLSVLIFVKPPSSSKASRR